MNTVLLAVVLALFVAIMEFDWWSELGITEPLFYGVVSGLIVGDVSLGFQVGAVCQLMSLGFYNFGGATTPNFKIGALFGVVAAKETGDYNIGLLVATVLGLLLMQTNILGRTINTFLVHAGEKALNKDNLKRFELFHLAGITVWMLMDAIPVFIGVLLKDNLEVVSNFATQFEWFTTGLKAMGATLPAIGFALLLSYMDIKKLWPFMLLGYCLFAYMGVPIIGLALMGAVAGGLYMMQNKTKEGDKEREVGA